MPVADVVVLVVAGLASGAINAVAGGGSLVLFPALVATGMGPLAANVTNSVSGWPGYVGGALGFREELAGQRARFLPLAVTVATGAAAGCTLLLVTPSDAFDAVVPGLVAAASLLLAVQPAVARRAGAPTEAGVARRRVRHVTLFLAAVYGGYFGGALGVILLGVLALTVPDTLRRLNALKTGLSIVVSSVGLVAFGLFGPVRWGAVAVGAPAALVGGYLGAGVARRIDDRVLRPVVVVFGLGVAAWLALR